LVVVNRALLDLVDRFHSEFPELPLLVVYERVADARAVATRHLPNVAAFSDAVERQDALSCVRWPATGSRPAARDWHRRVQ
jgi:hypothetical protein